MILIGTLLILTLFGLLFYISDRNHKKQMLAKFEPTKKLEREIDNLRDIIGDYRHQYRTHIESYNQVHEHLQKVTQQMQSLRKSQRILRENMIMRFGLVVGDKNREIFKRVAKQLEQL